MTPRGDRTPADVSDVEVSLADWLLQQIADDERVARAGGDAWKLGLPSTLHPNPTVYCTVTRGVVDGAVSYVCGSIRASDAEHIARWDPAQVLAECAAKRAIVELHAIVYRDIGWLEDDDGELVAVSAELPVCGWCVPKHSHFRTRSGVPIGSCLTVQLLAQPFAGRPGWREEWRVKP